MEPELVRFTINERVAVVTLDNPPMNALSPAVREALAEVFGLLAGRLSEVGAVVLTGEGTRAFAGGADIRSFLELDREGAMKRLARSREINALVENFPKPVIAAISGYCLGGGLELALCCDLRYADEGATLGFPEVNLGLFPGNGGTQRARRHATLGQVKKLMYTGEMIDAHEALRLGIIEKISEPGKVVEDALATARRIAGKGPLAISALKETLNSTRDAQLAQGLEVEARQWSGLADTEDMKEGVRAFLEKRAPVFKGR